MGWQGVRALMEAAIQTNYKHCDSLRLWRTKCSDEGVRLLCKFMMQAKSVKVFEVLDAEVTKVSCEMLSLALHQKHELPIQILKLDHNPIKSEGLRYLAEGISMNKQLKSLSLTYCQIDETAAESLFDIAIYQFS